MQQTLEIQQLLPKEGMRSTRDARLRTTGLEESIPPLESHSIGLHHETVDNHVLAVNLEKRISDECHFISVLASRFPEVTIPDPQHKIRSVTSPLAHRLSSLEQRRRRCRSRGFLAMSG